VARQPILVSFVDGKFAEATTRDTWIGGYPLMAPMIDIHTIGAGGGSIAMSTLVVPSALVPTVPARSLGPAAYGKGATGRRSPTRMWCWAT